MVQKQLDCLDGQESVVASNLVGEDEVSTVWRAWSGRQQSSQQIDQSVEDLVQIFTEIMEDDNEDGEKWK